MKISGRYRVGPETGLTLRQKDDIAAKIYRNGRAEEISTRCYLVRSRAVAALLWERALDEMYAERSHIVGPRSLIRIIGNSIRRRQDMFHYSDPNTISIEQAAMSAIRKLRLRLRSVANLDVEGTLGSLANPLVAE